MVVYLHDSRDEVAIRDIARLYPTRTLEGIRSLTRANMARVVGELMTCAAQVVVPDESDRLTDRLLDACRALTCVGLAPCSVASYLSTLMPTPVSAPPAHAIAEGAGVG